jgi:hypothetical protein
VDGRAGPRTNWALAIDDLPRYRRDIVRIACAEVGACEMPLGSNRGPRVDVYLAPTGLGGVPWCAAFVSWVLRQAALPGATYTASARKTLEVWPEVGSPIPGDLFGWVNPDGTGHVGFVIGYAAGSEDVATLEGNSNNCVRVCQRPRAGLQFRRVDPGAGARAEVSGVPLVKRQTEGTR